MEKDHFRKLKLAARYKVTTERGKELGSRVFGSFRVYLFALDSFYVELWKKMGMNEVVWIEVIDQARFDRILG